MRLATRCALTMSLLLAVPGFTGTSAAAAPIRECGQLAHRHAFNITTRAVGCREARRVVRRWNNTVAQRGGDGRVRGLYCRYRDIGYESGDIRCTGSGGRVGAGRRAAEGPMHRRYAAVLGAGTRTLSVSD
jgi:hypothetical protein